MLNQHTGGQNDGYCSTIIKIIKAIIDIFAK
ncbi:TPA: hypothetical protein PJ419_001261 [Staphylococcus aureus]|nr:hypothetical protein [Staphylococcus aureus]HEI7915025.1 hypothetical protein [Staphylococcus aureus]